MGVSKLVLLTVVVGLGFASLGWYVFARQPHTARPWNSTALTAAYEGAEMKEVDPANASILLTYELMNNADSDCRLGAGQDSAIMSRLRSDGSLVTQPSAHLAADTLVPAGERERAQIEIDAPFAWPADDDAAAQDKLKQFVNQTLSGVQEFDLFEQADRFQIQFPKGWEELTVNAAPAQ